MFNTFPYYKMEMTLTCVHKQRFLFFFFLIPLPFALAVVTMNVLSKSAHGDILGRGNRKITSWRSSKAGI